MTAIYLAVVATLLVVSAAINAYYFATRYRTVAYWTQREMKALDRARATELRSAEQIDAILERVHTAPRLDLETGRQAVVIDPDARRFFADDDDPVEERAWNKAHGEPVDGE